jgi:hypothetical protein
MLNSTKLVVFTMRGNEASKWVCEAAKWPRFCYQKQQ